MALDFNVIAGLDDVLTTDRHLLYFPSLPTGVDGKDLTLRHAEVSIPPFKTAKIPVNVFGWPVAFAGRREFETTFSVSFHETVNSPVIRSLYGWQNICSGFKTAAGQPKDEYAVDCKFKIKDTTGKSAIVLKLHNVWPETINFPEFGEETTAWHSDVEFSCDGIDLEGYEVGGTTYSIGSSGIGGGGSSPTRRLSGGNPSEFASSFLASSFDAGRTALTNPINALFKEASSAFLSDPVVSRLAPVFPELSQALRSFSI